MARPNLVYLYILLLISLTACAASAQATGPIDLTVIAKDFAYEPPTITIHAGQTVHLTFKNQGSVMHEFRVLGFGSEGHRVETKAEPGKEDRITFTADTPGTFPIVCEIPGHKEAGMVGQLIVQ